MTNREIRRRSEALVAQGRIQDAGQVLEAALRLQPFDTELNIAKANIMLAGRQYRKAMETLREVLDRRPDAIDARFLLGNTYRATRLFEDAAACYREVIRHAPDYPGAHHYLGVSCQQIGQLAEAEAAFAEAVRRRPELAILHFRLGSVRHMRGRHAEAVASYQEVLRREPDHQPALANLSLVLLAQQRNEEAMATAREHLQRRPGNPLGLANLSYAALGRGDRRNAARLLDFDRLLRAKPLAASDVDSLDLAALHAALEAAPILPQAPGTADAWWTEDLDPASSPVLSAAHSVLQRHAAQWLEDCRQFKDHPWAGTLPERWSLRMWGSRQPADSLEDSHCHPQAVAAGMLYLQTPDVADKPWLEFGRGDEAYRYLQPEKTPLLAPSPGDLLLFPGYFFYRCFPAGAGQRLRLAFEILAA